MYSSCCHGHEEVATSVYALAHSQQRCGSYLYPMPESESSNAKSLIHQPLVNVSFVYGGIQGPLSSSIQLLKLILMPIGKWEDTCYEPNNHLLEDVHSVKQSTFMIPFLGSSAEVSTAAISSMCPGVAHHFVLQPQQHCPYCNGPLSKSWCLIT